MVWRIAILSVAGYPPRSGKSLPMSGGPAGDAAFFEQLCVIIRCQGEAVQMSKAWCGAAAALLILTTMRALAHHSFAAEYDENSHVTVSGTVTEFKWINPHAWLYEIGRASCRERVCLYV